MYNSRRTYWNIIQKNNPIDMRQYPIMMPIHGDAHLLQKEFLEEYNLDEKLAADPTRWILNYIGDTPTVEVYFKTPDDISDFERVMENIFQRKKKTAFERVCSIPDLIITHSLIKRITEKCNLSFRRRSHIDRWMIPFLKEKANENFSEALLSLESLAPPEILYEIYKQYTLL